VSQTTDSDRVLAGLEESAAALEELYRDLHAHPELSLQEQRTASKAAEGLEHSGYEVTTGVGGTGVVGVLRNGDGPTVMLRADMDALPIREATGLPYASTATATDADGDEVPVSHACGHDTHVTWLAGATSLLARSRDAWHGTVLAVFQPAEETAQGARAMIDDGLFDRFPKPAVVFGQHVMPAPAGQIGYRPGTTQAAADSLEVRLFGRGAHGSMPESSVDPVVMAAATVLRRRPGRSLHPPGGSGPSARGRAPARRRPNALRRGRRGGDRGTAHRRERPHDLRRRRRRPGPRRRAGRDGRVQRPRPAVVAAGAVRTPPADALTARPRPRESRR
jgi:Peptidase family M20/M25/M40